MTTPMTAKEQYKKETARQFVERRVHEDYVKDGEVFPPAYRLSRLPFILLDAVAKVCEEWAIELESLLSDSQKENERLTNNETGMKIWEGLAGQRLDEVVSIRRDLSEAYEAMLSLIPEGLDCPICKRGYWSKDGKVGVNPHKPTCIVLTAQKARDGK
jgi:hypothetical protein